MSDAQDDRPSKLSGVAVLPWSVALVLFLVLLGVLAALGMGLTSAPVAEPEMAESSQAEEPPQPASEGPDDASTGTGEADEIVSETASGASSEPGMSADPEAARGGGTEPQPDSTSPDQDMAEQMSPEPDPAQAEALDEAVPTGAPDSASAPATPSSDAETEVASIPPPPPATAPSVETAPPVRPRRSIDALPPAPDPGLVEASPLGPLPKIGPNGREPWKVYARPFNTSDDRPRVAIVLSGLGLSSAATEAAIQGLPSEVTLAFQPFADNIQQWIRLSRAAGHEVLLNLPMEPVDIRSNDPGPRALFVSFTPEENLDRMRWALSRVSGYVGVVNHMGSRFTVSREAMQPVLTELKARGLLFLAARSAARSVATSLATEMQVPRAINDRFLDNREVSRATVDARLAEVESIAQEAGVSIAIGQAFPVTIERIRAWADTLDEKGIALVPISAVVDRQSDR